MHIGVTWSSEEIQTPEPYPLTSKSLGIRSGHLFEICHKKKKNTRWETTAVIACLN